MLLKSFRLQIVDLFKPITLIDVDGTEKTWPLPDSDLPFTESSAIGLGYVATEVRRCIRSNLLQSDSFKHNDSLIIAKTEEDIRKQLGVIEP